ncbi:MAG TPA: hypothetical protein VL946_06495 [Lacibacter sp.]|jgi:hypothetical protein|nr:hypothetical protein [Lacibacter sp.]
MNTETRQQELDLLRERIRLIPRAIMYNQSANPVHLPNDVVHVDGLDADGCLWISVSYPKYNHVFMEPHFPVKLCFFEKSVNFFIEADGMAYFNGLLTERHDMLLMKVVPASIRITEFERACVVKPSLRAYIDYIIEKIRQLITPKKETIWVLE